VGAKGGYNKSMTTTNTATHPTHSTHPTHAQLMALRAEAATAGDHDQVALCDLADDGVIDLDAHPHISLRLAARIIGGTLDGADASQMCGKVIASAAAQSEVRS
jgi:hypothetical protein